MLKAEANDSKILFVTYRLRKGQQLKYAMYWSLFINVQCTALDLPETLMHFSYYVERSHEDC